MSSIVDFLAAISPLVESFLLIAAGAFVGAFVAFRLEKHHESRKKQEAQLSAGRRAQFVLISQFNMLEALDRQHLAALRNSPQRVLALRPVAITHQVPRLDVDSLTYLLESDDPDVLNVLLVGEQSFESVLGLIEERNQWHNRFQSRLGQVEKQEKLPEELRLEDLERLVGKDVIARLVDLTDMLYELYEQARCQNQDNYKALAAALGRAFPKGKLLRYLPVGKGNDTA